MHEADSSREMMRKALGRIASEETGSVRDEAVCFLRVRKIARDLCEELGIPYTDASNHELRNKRPS